VDVRELNWPSASRRPSLLVRLGGRAREVAPSACLYLVSFGLLGLLGSASSRAAPIEAPEPAQAAMDAPRIGWRPPETRAPGELPYSQIALAPLPPAAPEEGGAVEEPPVLPLPPAPAPVAPPTPARLEVAQAPAPAPSPSAPEPAPPLAQPAAPPPLVAAPPKPPPVASTSALAPASPLPPPAPAPPPPPPAPVARAAPPSPPPLAAVMRAPAPPRLSAAKRIDRPKRPTPMSPEDAARHLTLALEQVTGEPATLELVSVLWGQWALETGRGRWMVDYNYAGLKGRAPDGGLANWWTWEETEKGPRRVRARFRSYETAEEGAIDYVALLFSRYPRALAAAQRGDAIAFVHELDNGKFFTERPGHYVGSVASLSLEFRRKLRSYWETLRPAKEG
jgi:hypothetical protein